MPERLVATCCGMAVNVSHAVGCSVAVAGEEGNAKARSASAGSHVSKSVGDNETFRSMQIPSKNI